MRPCLLRLVALSVGLAACGEATGFEPRDDADAGLDGGSGAGVTGGALAATGGAPSSSGGASQVTGGAASGGAPVATGGGTTGGSLGTGGAAGGAPPVLGSCCSGAVNHPFGATGVSYRAGTILPYGSSAAELASDVGPVYDAWKSNYLRTGCGGRYVAARTSEGFATVSEAHGYGMLIAVYMAGYDPDAHAIFDDLLALHDAYPSSIREGMMSWAVTDDCEGDDSSATDGDLDIAYALLLADRQWGSCGEHDYLGAALEIIESFEGYIALDEAPYLRLGDWAAEYSSDKSDGTRSSDFMPGHFRAFAAARGGQGPWDAALAGLFATFGALQSGYASDTGLVPDFIDFSGGAAEPAPPGYLERSVDGHYSYNACRVPWRLGVDGLFAADGASAAVLDPLVGFFRSETEDDATSIRDGYYLSGAPINGGNWTSGAFASPVGVGAMLDPSDQPLLDAAWDYAVEQDDQGYYEDTLRLLSLIAMSGNWWTPEAATCR